eukprot:g16614.t1
MLNQVLERVYAASCDVGAVGTPHLERVASQGTLSSSQVIPLTAWALIGQATHGDYPLLHSTALYAEWGLVRLQRMAPRLGELVRAALLLVEPEGNVGASPSQQTTDKPPWWSTIWTSSTTDAASQVRSGNCLIRACVSGARWECGPGFSTYFKGSTSCQPFELQFEHIAECDVHTNNTLMIAKLRVVGENDLHETWSPTFEDTINDFINRYGCQTRLQVLTKSQLLQAVEDKAVDFVFVDAGFFSVLEARYGWLGMLTVLLQHHGVITPYEGGVIFRQKALFQNVSSLEDLSGLNLVACASEPDDLTGFLVQQYEFFKKGMDIYQVFSEITFAHGQKEAVRMVLHGTCDIGLVQTRILEELAARGELSMADLAIINNMQAQSANHSNFRLAISTPLYHGWIFARAPETAESIWEQVQVPLLAMREEDAPAVRAGYSGFERVGNYQQEANVKYQLNLINPATGVCAPGSVRNATHALTPCVPCQAGKYNPDGLGECLPCHAEHFADEAGSTSCEECPEGKVAHQVGSKECVEKKEVLVYQPIEACADYPNKTLTVGVLRTGTVEETRAMWAPTFEDVLNDYFHRFDCSFRMLALSWKELEAAVQSRAVDFVFTYAGSYVNFKYDYGAEAIAEVVHYYQSRSYSKMGGVIFRHNNSHTQVKQLEHLEGLNLTACPVNENSFASWIGPWYEFFSHGLDVFKVFSEVEFTRDEIKTVEMVMQGDCDVGMVQTSLLETLSNQGRIALEDVYVINRTYHDEFPLLVSTLLYEEWPVLALPHVHVEIQRNAAIPLLALREYDVAAVLGKHAGFILPKSYNREEEVKFQLNLVHPERDLCQKGQARDLEHPLKPCTKCPIGRYNNDGLATCRACLPGFYNDEEGALACKACPAGRITYDSGQWECRPAQEVLTYHPIQGCKRFDKNTLKIGVLIEGTIEETADMWRPTFEGVMNEHFHRYQCFFEMVVLDWQELQQAMARQEIDLLFADPGVYVEYSNSHNLTAVASVLRILNHDITPNIGGVMFRKAENHPSLHELEDLQLLAQTKERLIACAVDLHSFSGWAAQWYEFFKRKIDINTVFRQVIFSESYTHTVEMVYNGECDVGMIRTSALERLAQEHLYEFEDFEVINHNKNETSFVQVLSTDLYPEWALGVLPHVPQDIADVARIPLLAMRETEEAAMVGHVAGFTTPYDYSSVSHVRWQLGLEPLATCGPGSYRDTAAFLTPCFQCPSGFFNPDGLEACQPCPMGTYAAVPGSFECLHCDFGYSTIGTGQDHCIPYEKHLALGRGAQLAVWILAVLLFLLCVWTFSMVVVYRDTRLIKASSFHFSLLLILACGVVCASTVLFAIEPAPNNWVCSLRWWLPCVFSSMVFGTLFSKTYRLYSIFSIYETKQKVPKSIRFKDTKVAALVACFVAVTVLMLIIFFAVDPPFYVRRQEILEGQNYFTYTEACHISKVFVPLIFAMYVLLLSCQSYLAFKVRKLPTVFNESQLIAWLLYNTVFLGLVGIMVDYMLDWTQITVAMMVRAVALFLGSMTPVVVLYAPKLAEIFRDQQNNTKYSTGSKTNSTGGTGHTNIKSKGPEDECKSKLTDREKRGPQRGSYATTAQKTPNLAGSSRDIRVHSSNLNLSQKHASAVSALTGVSDVGDTDDHLTNHDFEIELVPDSEIAGDEYFEVDMSSQLRGEANKFERKEDKRLSIGASGLGHHGRQFTPKIPVAGEVNAEKKTSEIAKVTGFPDESDESAQTQTQEADHHTRSKSEYNRWQTSPSMRNRSMIKSESMGSVPIVFGPPVAAIRSSSSSPLAAKRSIYAPPKPGKRSMSTSKGLLPSPQASLPLGKRSVETPESKSKGLSRESPQASPQLAASAISALEKPAPKAPPQLPALASLKRAIGGSPKFGGRILDSPGSLTRAINAPAAAVTPLDVVPQHSMPYVEEYDQVDVV